MDDIPVVWLVSGLTGITGFIGAVIAWRKFGPERDRTNVGTAGELVVIARDFVKTIQEENARLRKENAELREENARINERREVRDE